MVTDLGLKYVGMGLAAIALGQGEMDWSSFARIAARNAGL